MAETQNKWGGPTERIIIETNINLVAGVLDEIKTKKISKETAVNALLGFSSIFFSIVPEDATEITFADGLTITHNGRIARGLDKKNYTFEQIRAEFEATNVQMK